MPFHQNTANIANFEYDHISIYRQNNCKSGIMEIQFPENKLLPS